AGGARGGRRGEPGRPGVRREWYAGGAARQPALGSGGAARQPAAGSGLEWPPGGGGRPGERDPMSGRQLRVAVVAGPDPGHAFPAAALARRLAGVGHTPRLTRLSAPALATAARRMLADPAFRAAAGRPPSRSRRARLRSVGP